MKKYLKRTLVSMVMLVAILMISACGKEKEVTSDADWPGISLWRSIGLEATLPAPSDAKLRLVDSSDTEVTIIVKNCTQTVLDDYVSSLNDFGFSIKVGSSQNKPFGSVDTYQLSSNSAVSVCVGLATKDNEKIGILAGDMYIKVIGTASE